MKDKKNTIDVNDLYSDLWSKPERFEEYLKKGLVDADSLYKALLTNAPNNMEWQIFLCETGSVYDYCRILHEYGISLKRIDSFSRVLAKSAGFGLFIHVWLTPNYEKWKELGIDVDACYLISADSAIDAGECSTEILIKNIFDYPAHLQKAVMERVLDDYPLDEIIEGVDSVYGEMYLVSMLIDVGVNPTRLAEKFKRELKYEDARWEDCAHMINLLEHGSGLLDIDEIIKALSRHAKNNYGEDPEEDDWSDLTESYFNRLKALGVDPKKLISLGIKPMEKD